MSYQFVNGYTYPMFRIIDDKGQTEYVNLDYCGANGLTESNEFIYLNHTLIDYSTIQQVQGMHIHFDLDYADYSDSSNTLNIQKVLNAFLNQDIGYKVYLYPRAENLNRYFEIILESQEVAIGIMKGGNNAVGNNRITLKFRTKNLQRYMTWDDTNLLAVIPMGNFFTIIN